MIVLLTDFGPAGPYVGQMKGVLAQESPDVPVIDLVHDLPAFDPRGAAYLTAAVASAFPSSAVFLCVVDPGVGSDRTPLALRADDHWFVGPDNGLLAIAARRASHARWSAITWAPAALSASFHGRDLFAPVAARLARGEPVPGRPISDGIVVGTDWPDDLAAIVYVDHYGNAMTGLRAATVPLNGVLMVGDRRIERGRTFSDVAPGDAFWYENANGLAEIAVNQGRAASVLDLRIGTPVRVEST